MRAWVLVAAVFWYLPRTGWQRFSEVTKKGFIYGKPANPVKVYVELHHNSPFLVCMDIKHAKKETVDPTYSWIGPDEKPLKGNNQINITQTGKLMVKDFPESLSGLYTCTFSYKIIKAQTQVEKTVKQRYEFMMFAYREPDYSYQMAVRYTTKSCVGSYNDLFFRELKKVLDNLIFDLSCHVIESSYKCHFVKLPEHGLVYELFIAFQVNPFASQWKSACLGTADCEEVTNPNILQARDRIAEFFRRQAYLFYHDPNKILPVIHFVDHSFEMARIDTCRPGFGKSEGLHSNCATCCVVCSPGTFSPDANVTCQTCASAYAYGAKLCPQT